MKKLGKLTALLFSLLMIVSLFTACGDAKKDEKKDETTVSETEKEKLTGEALLIGTWDVEQKSTDDEYNGLIRNFSLIFNDDHTIEQYVSEKNQNDYVDRAAEIILGKYTDEELAEDGFESREEAEKYIKDSLNEDYSARSDFGTWELDGDTLTIYFDGNEDEFAAIETKLSEGTDNFTYTDETDECILTFAKAD